MYFHSTGSKNRSKNKGGRSWNEIELTRVQIFTSVIVLVFVLVSRLAFMPALAEEGTTEVAPLMTASAENTTPDGINGGDPIPPAEGNGASGSAENTDTTVTTGDATATLGEGNTVNTNTSAIVPGGDATTTESFTAEGAATTTVTNENENSALLDNTGTTTAATGENTAVSGGNATITTGDATAQAAVLNVANTNVVNSSGFIAFLSNLFGSFGALDLRSLPVYTNDNHNDTNNCTIFGCGNILNFAANITSSSTANIFNSFFVRAFSGGNTASTTGNGNAAVDTGNAYAAANIVNVANTNIVDSNYMMLVFNNFGDWNGDFIFPGKDYFANKFLASTTGENIAVEHSSTAFDTTNTADVGNNITTGADSGANTASTTESAATVLSGAANATSNVLNHVNHNVYGGSSLAVIFRVHGNWSGSVYSLPPGILWSETPDGIAFFSDGSASADSTGSDSVHLSTAAEGTTASTTIGNQNTATIQNDVQVYALTGENKVATEEGKGTIKTGNAYAGSNVVNVVNTNLYGTNWILAIIDIFGDWTGNIAFGRPDLWIGGWVEGARSPLEPHDALEYHFTVANRGDTDATDVHLTGHIDDRMVFIYDTGIPGNDGMTWNLGTIHAGETRDVTYRAELRGHVPFGSTSFDNSATVTSYEPDANVKDNTEHIGTLVAYNPPQATGNPGVYYTTMPKLEVTKENNASTTVLAPGVVDYKVKIFNNSLGHAYQSVLHDILKDENGKVIYEENWPLDTILPNEEITITYSIEFNASSTSGVYTNYAQVKAMGGSELADYGSVADSPTVTSSIRVQGVENGEATSTVTVYTDNTPPAPKDLNDVIENLLTTGSVKGKTPGVARSVHGGTAGGISESTEGGSKLPKVVDLHPLALATPGNGSLASSWWGNQSAATFAAVLGSPWLYIGLLLIFFGIVVYEKRRKNI